MYRVVKIHRFSFIFRIYYIRVGHFQFRVGKESLKDLISFVFQVEKFVKKTNKTNKTTRVGGLLAHARTTGSLSNKTEKGYIYSSLRPFLSMSLHFYYFFLFLYIVDPSILFPLSRHGGGGGSSSAQQHATIKGTCLLLPLLQLTRAEKQKRKGCWL